MILLVRACLADFASVNHRSFVVHTHFEVAIVNFFALARQTSVTCEDRSRETSEGDGEGFICRTTFTRIVVRRSTLYDVGNGQLNSRAPAL